MPHSYARFPVLIQDAAIVYAKDQTVFSQGDPADAVFCVQHGKVKLSVFSRQGKEAVIAILTAGDFFGEACLAGHPVRTSSATAMSDSSIVRLEKPAAMRMLETEPLFSQRFVSHLLARNTRMEEDLVDQLLNSSEKRLARVLLLLANSSNAGSAESGRLDITQETLAEMIGTTRPRVSAFMNKFRKRGLVEYDDRGLRVNGTLLTIFLYD